MWKRQMVVDRLVRWRQDDYDKLKLIADQLNMSTGGLIRAIVLAWLQQENQPIDDADAESE